MLSLVLAAVLSASPQTFLVSLEPSSVYLSWQEPILAGAVEEVRASHGRVAYTKHDARHTGVRFVLTLNVAQFATSAVATAKLLDLSDGGILGAERVPVPQPTKELCVAEVRKLVRKLLDRLPPDLPPAEPPKKK